MEFEQSPSFKSFIFNGDPFFITSLTKLPSISIIVLECERSVIAKSLSLKSFLNVS